MQAACCSDRGKVRLVNEDRALVSPEWGVFAVADGMGGHRAGEVASELAISILAEELCSSTRATTDSERLLASVIRRANQEILICSNSRNEYSGMGTTLTVGLVQNGLVTIGHIGDSRAYYYGPGGLKLLTRDHSVVGDLVMAGQLNDDEARVHPRRNLLTRALGIGTDVEIDFFTRELTLGSLLLFCSDGLAVNFSTADLEALLRDCTSVELTVSLLVQLAVERDGSDNVTAVLVAV